MTQTEMAGSPDFRPTSLSDAVPLPEACPTCGRSDVKWFFQGAISQTKPSFIMTASWVHRDGFTAHAVTWSPEQVAAARAVALRDIRILNPEEDVG